MSKKKGSPFLIEPIITILPDAKKSLGEFKFVARQVFPAEHIVSIEGEIAGTEVRIIEFVDNIEYTADAKNWSLDYPIEAVTRAKQAAAGRRRQWLGTIHSHPYLSTEEATVNLSLTDHISGHFHAESVSGIYTIQKTKSGRLWSPPISFFIPQGKLKVIFG